jgi:hypothetical protein
MPTVTYAECHYAECHYAECRGASFRAFVNSGRKKFYNIEPRDECYKTIYVRGLRIFLIS